MNEIILLFYTQTHTYIYIYKKIHSQLCHDNIVKLMKVAEDEDYHYLMLEICDEGDLYTYLKSKGR